MKVTYTRNEKTYEIDTDQVVGGLAYLLQYGFSQSLQDSIAGRAKSVREEMTDAKDKPAGWTVPSEAVIAAAIDADIDGMLQKRSAAILAGTVAVRTSEPKDPWAGIIREILVKSAAKQGKKLPKADSDEYKALVEKVRTSKADWITKELARRAKMDMDIEL
jgi:hypothetical protein